MNSERFEGIFDQVKGKIKETWGRLTDDEIAFYNGKQEQFYGVLKEKYGIAKDEAEKRLQEFSGRNAA